MAIHHIYKGFEAWITPDYEPTKSRLARGDWRSRILGYTYHVRYRGRIYFSVDQPLPSLEDAMTDFENRIDVIIDSL